MSRSSSSEKAALALLPYTSEVEASSMGTPPALAASSINCVSRKLFSIVCRADSMTNSTPTAAAR